MYHALTYTSPDNIQKGWMYTTETKMVYTYSTICHVTLHSLGKAATAHFTCLQLVLSWRTVYMGAVTVC